MRNRAGVITIDEISESKVALGAQIVLIQISGGNRVSETLRKLTGKRQSTTKTTVCYRREWVKDLREPEMFESLTKQSAATEKRAVSQMCHREIWIKLKGALERRRVRRLVGL
jgi:hypothetical protein